MERHTLRIGTRGSDLARWQAGWVSDRVQAPTEIVVIKTSGDRLKDVSLQGQSTMGFFTREIERALLADEIDLAVHSLKDLPVEQPEGLVLASISQRHDVQDVLLVRPWAHDPDRPIPVKPGSKVGAGSLRRKFALGALDAQLEPVLVRGNVPTRVRKTESGVVDAMIIARAGVSRLGLDVAPLVPYDLDPDVWIPAPGQACLAVEIRQDDAHTREAVRPLEHGPSRQCVELERRLLALSGGGCHAPFASWARPVDGEGQLQVSVGAPSPDGVWRTARFTGSVQQVEAEARRWFGSGCPETDDSTTQEAPCRPARPWC